MGKVKVVLYTTGDCIHFVSRFLFRNKWLHYWLEENICGSLLRSASQPFFFFYDSLSSNNKACLRRSANKTKCTINGAIVRADRKKSEAWVDSGKERSSPDPTRPKSPLFYYSTAAIVPCTISLRFCFVFFLLNERLEKTSNNKKQLNMSSVFRDMLNSLEHSTSFR